MAFQCQAENDPNPRTLINIDLCGLAAAAAAGSEKDRETARAVTFFQIDFLFVKPISVPLSLSPSHTHSLLNPSGFP